MWRQAARLRLRRRQRRSSVFTWTAGGRKIIGCVIKQTADTGLYAEWCQRHTRKRLFSEAANITCNLSTGRESDSQSADHAASAVGFVKAVCHAGKEYLPLSALWPDGGKYLSWAFSETVGRKDWNEPILVFEKAYREQRNAGRLQTESLLPACKQIRRWQTIILRIIEERKTLIYKEKDCIFFPR